MSEYRILIATDVPFWNRSTGAEQRVAALVGFFQKKSICVRTFFINNLASTDQQRIVAQGLDVVHGSSDKPPTDALKRIRWYGEASLHQLKTFLKRNASVEEAGTLSLKDYRWPWAVEQFSQCLTEFKPNCILIEYVKLGYLLSGIKLEQRKQILCMVDTHDVLYARNEQHRERGFPHWLDITREQEAQALQMFDLILAIQSQEARVFRELAPDSRTIVVGHSIEHQFKNGIQAAPKRVFVAGYIGSKNISNLSAVSSLLDDAWRQTLAPSQPEIELHIAGSICDWVSDKMEEALGQLPNVKLLGRVDNLEAFYSTVDVVINPVEFGTGLKIKNCEALAYGCPLITTPSGFEGMPDGLEDCVFVVRSLPEMIDRLVELALNRDEIRKMRGDLSDAARHVFSDESAYSELYEALLS